MSREFTYKISVDTESIQKAAQQVRSVFARAVSFQNPGSLNTTVIQRIPQGMQIAPAVQQVSQPAPAPLAQPVRPPVTPTAPVAGGIGGMLRSGANFVGLGGLLGAGAGLLALNQMGKFAEYSVNVERTSRAFELLSGSAQNAEAKLRAVQEASGGAIDKMTAMQIANKVGALGMAKTAEELERVTRFATIAGRVLGIDTAGALDNMAMAASNLSWVRLDQMGINASAVRKEFNELRGSMDDNSAFLEAMLRVGERTFGSLNDATLTNASGMERLGRSIADAKMELIGFGSAFDGWAGNAANAIDRMVNNLNGGFESPAVSLEEMHRQAARNLPTLIPGAPYSDAQRQAIQQQMASVGKLKDAMDALSAAEGNAHVRMVGMFDETEPVELAQIIDRLSDAYARLSQLEQAGVVSADELAPVETAWQGIVRGIADGSMELDIANAQLSRMLVLLGQIAPMIGPAVANVSRGIPEFASLPMQNWANRARTEQLAAGTIAPKDLTADEQQYRLAVGDLPEKLAIYSAMLDRVVLGTEEWMSIDVKKREVEKQIAAQEESTRKEIKGSVESLIDAQFRYALSTEDLSGQIEMYKNKIAELADDSIEELNARTQLGNLERQLANEQAAGAKRVEAEWKAAAEKTAQEFENAIRKVPGLFGTSPVTQSQMERAAAGIPQRFPDSFLREMEDQVLNGVPRGINVQEVAKQAGIDPSLPEKIITQMFREMWESRELFANQENISRFVDMDAVQAELAKQGREAQGEKNLLNALRGQAGVFGFGAGTPDNLDAFLNQLTGENGVAAQVNKGMAEATAGVADMGRVALAQFNDSNSLTQFYQIGKMSAGETFRGWAENIGSAPFAAAMAESIKQSIIEEFQEVFNGSR